ncbi:sigma-70 family RNA polymerase sigma factor [Dactylosporangium vinaceum]|uniref:RNA polymerase sigma factor n=1 Tax=Dactylosporangium vinaceum TaxID=53362 RepID=A0ABV5M787_9ACTN|nr:sigma-70 family RNA polymerase sigma factor [Dactylosporangium vinaceum]UAC00604.1 sigma-70 family RNA polymerase sigma factor [Dactylosporangium vinaceum]
MTDALLVVRAQLGERDALAALVRAWHDPVWSYVRRMLPAAAADDVAQEVWLAVLRGLPRLRDPERFTPWLFTVARRAVTNRLRVEYARPEVFVEVDLARPDGSAEVLDRAEVAAGLAALPAREREILILFYLHDLALETCAEICAVPVGTVKSRLNRARRLLREALLQKGSHT